MRSTHCPKCNKEVSAKLKTCPNCGYRFEKKGRKLSIVQISLVLILLLAICILFAVKPSELLLVSVQISSLGEINSNSEEAITQAEQNYENLNDFQKIFITNYDDLKNARMTFDALPVTLTIDNINEYITFNISYSNYKNKSTIYPFFHLSATATMTIDYSSLKDVVYENTQIIIHCGYEAIKTGWKEIDLVINISENGVGSVSTSISFGGVWDGPHFPNFTKITIISVTGTARHK